MVQPRGMCIVAVFSSLCITPSPSPGVNSKVSMNLDCALVAERTWGLRHSQWCKHVTVVCASDLEAMWPQVLFVPVFLASSRLLY